LDEEEEEKKGREEEEIRTVLRAIRWRD